MRFTKSTLVGAALITGAAVAALSLPAAASGGHVVPGSECKTVGQTGVARNGSTYRCEQHEGDDCPRWHWIYNPQVPRGSWSPRPHGPCDCPPSTTPSPSGTPSSSPSPSTSVSAAGTPTATSTSTGTTTVGNELPVTGPATYWTAGAGLFLLVLGAGAIAAGRRRQRRFTA